MAPIAMRIMAAFLPPSGRLGTITKDQTNRCGSSDEGSCHHTLLVLAND
jgi:hypothetical protein